METVQQIWHSVDIVGGDGQWLYRQDMNRHSTDIKQPDHIYIFIYIYIYDSMGKETIHLH